MGELIHASCVACEGQAVLLAGPSGIGKSDIALRLILEHGAQLVSDDQTELSLAPDGILTASAPQAISGLIEVRHVGLMRFPFLAGASLALYVELVPFGAEIERWPESSHFSLLDRPVRRLRLPGYAASTPAKIVAALTQSFEDER